MTDAERFMIGYMQAVAESPTRIAPERDKELFNGIFSGKQSTLEFTNEVANFAAFPDGHIEASYSALLSLWAVSDASLLIAQTAADARREGYSQLPSDPGSPIFAARQLIDAAVGLIRNPQSTWPSGLRVPNPSALGKTPEWAVNNLMLASTGWVLLHEIAHITLKHQARTTDALRREQEFQADKWAAEWILAKSPPGVTREFRVFAIATGLAWLGLINTVRHSTVTHPPAAQRLLNCASLFFHDDLSPALEMAGDVLKVLFDPGAELEPSDHPADAFIQVALHLRGKS